MRIVSVTSTSLSFLLVGLLNATEGSAAAGVGVSKVEDSDIRLKMRAERNYTWPIEEYVPRTTGWAKLYKERFEQVAAISNPERRYNGYRDLMPSALIAPNFTEHGFGLARAPVSLLEELQHAIHNGLPNAFEEYNHGKIVTGKQPLFIDPKDLADKAMHIMQPFAEEWAGVPLIPKTAYGFRLYREGNQLLMHSDVPDTHVIGFVLHIDSSDDAEPWPIFIEDFHGRTHSVVLTPGDVLMYESSKCMHGRPKPFKGDWYTSLFVHYYPVGYTAISRTSSKETHYAVPPHWTNDPPTTGDGGKNRKHEELELSGGGFREPNCPYGWCRASQDDVIQWSGPGQEGYYITPQQEKVPFMYNSPDPEENGEL